MAFWGNRAGVFLVNAFLFSSVSLAQIDPDKRQLFQLGYDQPLEGHEPLAAYAYYYWNQPEFFRTNLTLRMAIAPVYLDSELGISHALGKNTDIGIGLAGGGFADSYSELRGGKFHRDESFDGYGGGASVSLYHLFNPSQRIPLHAIARAAAYYSTYAKDDDTSSRFELPDDRASANFRIGLRLGGKEPVLFPSVAMELSVWAESLNRGNSGEYGFNGDREVQPTVALFYTHAYLAYTFKRGDNLSVSLTAGESVDADRFSAYRLGGMLPLSAEYPLILPGYYHQEISADRFVLLNGRYAVTLDEKKRWQLAFMASTAVVDYLKGFEQRGDWHSGVGGGIAYKSVSEIWKVAVNYGYALDARRDNNRGAQVVGVLLQYDLERWLVKRRDG